MYAAESLKIPCVIMRGGTSKAVFLLENDLPSDPVIRDNVILSIYGSPDPRQIDGLGGADPLTSKLAIIGPSTHPEADIDYTFGQVDIRKKFIDYSSNCGNISSAVGPYAIQQSLIAGKSPVTTVRIHNTNTGKILISEVPMLDRLPKTLGDFQIDGVPGTGAKILLNFAGTAGSKTGRLLPTGNVRDVLNIDHFGELEVSLVDIGSPMVFVRAEDLSLKGTETPAEIDGSQKMLELLENIRAKAAEKMGIVSDWRIAVERVRAVPMVAFVSKSQTYDSYLTGESVEADTIDFVSRDMFMQVMHKTYSVTATVCTGSAAIIPGTIVNEVMRKNKTGNSIRFGHPGGSIEIEMMSDTNHGELTITRAAVGRTARRIMEGCVYVPSDLVEKGIASK